VTSSQMTAFACLGFILLCGLIAGVVRLRAWVRDVNLAIERACKHEHQKVSWDELHKAREHTYEVQDKCRKEIEGLMTALNFRRVTHDPKRIFEPDVDGERR
jgi:hypothetical protein